MNVHFQIILKFKISVCTISRCPMLMDTGDLIITGVQPSNAVNI